MTTILYAPGRNPLNPFSTHIQAVLIDPSSAPETATRIVADVSAFRNPGNALWQLGDAFSNATVAAPSAPQSHTINPCSPSSVTSACSRPHQPPRSAATLTPMAGSTGPRYLASIRSGAMCTTSSGPGATVMAYPLATATRKMLFRRPSPWGQVPPLLRVLSRGSGHAALQRGRHSRGVGAPYVP